jgi:pSer/pThr/pTyr-binding forkhead associated (FHA) protein
VLVVKDGPQANQDFQILRLPAVIGRENPKSSPDILFKHCDEYRLVSRQHAIIDYFGGRFVLREANAQNSTSVNGQRVDANASAGLKDGDEIILGGKVRLSFKIPHDSISGVGSI